MTPNDGLSLFSIVVTNGEVKLNGRLNYTGLSTFYRLKIKATVSIMLIDEFGLYTFAFNNNSDTNPTVHCQAAAE